MGVNDGGGHCECEKCLQLRTQFNNQYIAFYNAVAREFQKEFPGKLVSFITYGKAGSVPKNVNLEPNLYIEMFHGYTNNFKMIKEWKAVGAKNIGLYHWIISGGFVIPRYFPRVLGEMWKHVYKEYGMLGGWMESYIQVWLYDGPLQYVVNELAWNINADIEWLLNDYFNNFYGSAGQLMKDFFDRLEEVHKRQADPLVFHHGGWPVSPVQLENFTRKDLDFLDEKLSKAISIAREKYELDVLARLELFNRIWLLSRSFIESYVSLKEMQTIEFVTDYGQIERFIERVNKGFKSIKSIREYKMSEDEAKSIFVNTTLEKYKNKPSLIADFPLEQESFRVFNIITKYMEMSHPQDIEKFWLKIASETDVPQIKKLALSQIFVRKSPESKENLIRNPSFEPEVEYGEDLFAKDSNEKFEWGVSNRKIEGWTTNTPPGTMAKFYWDRSESHSGKYSLSIRTNESQGCFQTRIRVKPGCSYLLEFWVKQSPPDKGGNVLIQGGMPQISVSYPKSEKSQWHRVNVFLQFLQI